MKYRTSNHYRVAWPTWCSTDIQRGAQQNSPAVVSYYTHTIRPFLTRKFFQESLGLEGSEKILEKNCQVHNLMISDRLLRSKISSEQPIIMRIEDRLFDGGWVRSAMATRKCGNIYFRKYFMAVRKFTNIFVLLLILMVGSRDTLFLVCFT